MDLKSEFTTQSQWELYRNEIRKAFRKVLIGHESGFLKFKDATNLMNKIDWRFAKISNEKIYLRQDRKEEFHQAQMDRYRKEAHELIEVLNENFVMEILLGD